MKKEVVYFGILAGTLLFLIGCVVTPLLLGEEVDDAIKGSFIAQQRAERAKYQARQYDWDSYTTRAKERHKIAKAEIRGELPEDVKSSIKGARNKIVKTEEGLQQLEQLLSERRGEPRVTSKTVVLRDISTSPTAPGDIFTSLTSLTQALNLARTSLDKATIVTRPGIVGPEGYRGGFPVVLINDSYYRCTFYITDSHGQKWLFELDPYSNKECYLEVGPHFVRVFRESWNRPWRQTTMRVWADPQCHYQNNSYYGFVRVWGQGYGF